MAHLGLVLLTFAFVFAVIAATFQTVMVGWHFGWGSIAFWIGWQLLGGIGKALG